MIDAALPIIKFSKSSAKPVLNLKGTVKEPINSLTSDGEKIYFPLWERIGDLWIAELETNMGK